jgi:hypothetical protein
MPEEFCFYKSCYTWRHVTSIVILAELRSETLKEIIFSTFELPSGFSYIVYGYEQKKSNFDNTKWRLCTIEIKAGISRFKCWSR